MTEQEFQTFLRSIRPADRAAMDAAARRQAELAKPPGSLGALEDVSIRLAGLTGRVKNRIDRCRVLVFAADNGVTAEGVSATPVSVTLSQSINMTRHITGMSALAAAFGDSVVVTDVGIDADVHCPEIVDRKIRRSTRRYRAGARHDAGAGADGHFRRHGAGAARRAGRYAGRRHRRDGHRQHHDVGPPCWRR